MSIHLGRRRAVQGLAALGAAGASGGVGLSFGQTRSLSATTYFGAWETAHRGILVPAFQKASGVKQVNLVPSLAVDTVSRAALFDQKMWLRTYSGADVGAVKTNEKCTRSQCNI